MNEIKCGVIRDLLPLYHDGVCSEESKVLVEEHLISCESCREELAGMDAAAPAVPESSEAETLRAVGSAWGKVKKRTFRRGLRVGLAILVCAAVCVGLFFAFFFVRDMPGVAMEPAIGGDAHCLFYRYTAPERGDIVAVSLPWSGAEMRDVIRVAGVPGDVIDCRDGTLTINGEPYMQGAFGQGDTVPGDREYPFTLGENEYFLLDDNQAFAIDSRFTRYGDVTRGDIKGVLFTVLPELKNPFDRTESAPAQAVD